MRTSEGEEGFLSSRRYFWVFVAIFSVTIFCASTHIAARYCTYVETTRRLSQPGDLSPAPSSVAGAKTVVHDCTATPERSTDQPVRPRS